MTTEPTTNDGLNQNQILAVAAATSATAAFTSFSEACVQKHGWADAMLKSVYTDFLNATYDFLKGK